MTLGERLVMLRKQGNITQEELGSILHISRQAIQKWESDSSLPNIYMLRNIADYFNVTVDYLIDGTEPDIVEVPSDNSSSEDLIEYIAMINDLIVGVGELVVKYGVLDSEKICELSIETKQITIDTNEIINTGLSARLLFELVRCLYVYNEVKNNTNATIDTIMQSCNIFASKFCEKVYDVKVEYKDKDINKYIETEIEKFFQSKFSNVLSYLKNISSGYVIDKNCDFSYKDYYFTKYLYNSKKSYSSNDESYSKTENKTMQNNNTILKHRKVEPVVKGNFYKPLVESNGNYKAISYVFFGLFVVILFIYNVIQSNFFDALPYTIGSCVIFIIPVILLAKRKILKKGTIILSILVNMSLSGMLIQMLLNHNVDFDTASINSFIYGPVMCLPFDIGMALLYKSVK